MAVATEAGDITRTTRAVEMFSGWLVKLLLADVTSMLIYSVFEAPLGLSYIQKLQALPTRQLVDDTCGIAVDGSIY